MCIVAGCVSVFQRTSLSPPSGFRMSDFRFRVKSLASDRSEIRHPKSDIPVEAGRNESRLIPGIVVVLRTSWRLVGGVFIIAIVLLQVDFGCRISDFG